MKAGTIRLVIADDHPTIRQGLAYAFSFESDFHLISAVTNGNELLVAVKKYQPDIVVTDLKMAELGGCEASAMLQAEFPAFGVIAFSGYDSEELIVQMRKNGVKGFLLKGADSSEVVNAIRAVYHGGEYYCRSIRQRMDRLFRSGRLGCGSYDKREAFTEIEMQIIRLFYRGLTARGIAAELKIKERTVQTHKEHIKEKMGVKGEIGIVVYALENWLLY